MSFDHLSEHQRHIVDDLRTEICLDTGKAPLLLHEAEIAERYGLSRTPVRQVLQYLSHCNMVETQRGVGTVVLPLIAANRDSDLRAYAAISKGCALYLEGQSIPKEVIVDISGLKTWLALLETRSEDDFIEMNKRLINVMSSIIPDGLLHHAYTSAHWRVLRWRIRDIRGNEALNWQKLAVGLEEAVEVAMKQDAAALMSFAAKMGFRHMAKQSDLPAMTFGLPA